MTEEFNDTDDKGREWQSTTWDQVEAAVDTGGHREGFVKVFLEYRGAVLDDCPLDARGRPEVVNQANFARHFGIAASTFHRWLTIWGGREFELEGERKEKADEAKARQSTKASKKNRDTAAQEVRQMVAETREDFAAKRQVRRADDEFWLIDVDILLGSDLPTPDKAKEAELWYMALEQEIEAARVAAEKLLEWITANDARDGADEVHAA